MKKICLLAIGSFLSALAFSQNVATTQTVPGQPKQGHGIAAQTATPPTFNNVNGTAVAVNAKQGNTPAVATVDHKQKIAAIKNAQKATTEIDATNRAATKIAAQKTQN